MRHLLSLPGFKRRDANDRGARPSAAPAPAPAAIRELAIGLAVVALGTACLSVLSIAPSVSRYTAASRSVCDLRWFNAVLGAATIVSAERGPANALMALGASSRPEAVERLAEFRARSDAMLTDLTSARHDGECLSIPMPAESIARVRDRLAGARREVDRVIAAGRPALTSRAFRQAIDGMFQVSDRFDAATVWAANAVVRRNPDLAAPTMIGYMLVGLRDFGGRAASDIVPAIAVGEPISRDSLLGTRASQGRLHALWHLIRSQTEFYDDPFFVQGRAAIEARLFGEGFALLDGLVAEGRDGVPYSMTVLDLTDRFVPTLQPVEDYRAAFVDAVMRMSEAKRTAALRTLALAAVFTAAIAVLLGAIVLSLRHRVFRPLLQVREDVVRLAEDRQPVHRSHASQPAEIRALFRAISTLQAKLQERAVMANELRVQAETDGLTGLFNRRTLERFAQAATATGEVCLILMDIDHFKRVNDTHGHATGDRVLVRVAELLRASLRSDDAVGRLGGEEFAILLSCGDVARGGATAEKIRAVIHDAAFTSSDGAALHITASFGVATCRRGSHAWPGLLEAADAALYRAKSEGRDRVRQAGS